jgi:hypothetical protein
MQYRAAAALGGDGEAEGGEAEGDHEEVSCSLKADIAA